MQRETPLAIPADHPAFVGHFPGTPIVPGVVLLDAALFAIEAAAGAPARPCRIASAKFFHPAGPRAALVIRHETLANGSVRFDILDGPRTIASGSVVADGPPGTPPA